MQIHLRIAGCQIRIEEPQDRHAAAWPMPPFDQFFSASNDPPDITTTIEIVRALPLLRRGPVRFDSCQGLWGLYEADAGFVVECLDPRTSRPRLVATVSPCFSVIEVFALEQEMDGTPGWAPMHVINPVIEFCLVTRIARDGGMTLHAAGVLSPQKGYAFTGPSGAGKSTLSHLFAEGGAAVLSDERMILRSSRDGIVAYGTPWVGSGRYARNASGRLTELYCIRHGHDAHRIETINPGAMISTILQQCFLPHWDRTAMESTLIFLSDMIQRIPCRALAFLNQPDIVEYLDHQHAELSLVSP